MAERMIIQSGENIRAMIALMVVHETNLRTHLRGHTFDFQFLLGRMTDASTNTNTNPYPDLDVSLNVTYTTFSEIDDQNETSCPITYEPFSSSDEVVVVNTCKHYFKKEAFLTWSSHSNTCPVCRTSTIL